MATYSETIQQRYSASEVEKDIFGRAIKVQRLRPWDAQQVRRIIDSDRANVASPAYVASCVRSITDENGTERLFAPPKTEADIAVIFGALDEEGLGAAALAYGRLIGVALQSDGETSDPKSTEDATKNS